jgi:hypothetical protein
LLGSKPAVVLNKNNRPRLKSLSGAGIEVLSRNWLAEDGFEVTESADVRN